MLFHCLYDKVKVLEGFAFQISSQTTEIFAGILLENFAGIFLLENFGSKIILSN